MDIQDHLKGGILGQILRSRRFRPLVGPVVIGIVIEIRVVDDAEAHFLENSCDLLPYFYDIIRGIGGPGRAAFLVGRGAVLGVGLGGVGVQDQDLRPRLRRLKVQAGAGLGNGC